jgi:serine/threonine protein kinase
MASPLAGDFAKRAATEMALRAFLGFQRRGDDVRVLGQGGFGSAFRVGSFVVKIMRMTKLKYLELFLKEVEIWGDLAQKDELEGFIPQYYGYNIVNVTAGPTYEYLSDDQARVHNFVTNQLHGVLLQQFERVQDLHTVLDELRGLITPLSLSRFINLRYNERIAGQFIDNLVNAYDMIHKAGYIHRDIKPANILVREDARVQTTPIVIDVGLACKMPCEDTDWWGTPGYVPENYNARENRSAGRTFKTQKKKATLGMTLRRGWKTLMRIPHRKPILPSKEQVYVRQGNQVIPGYSVETDNYALGLTIQQINSVVKWQTQEAKEKYETLALKLIGSAAGFVAGRPRPGQQRRLNAIANLNANLNRKRRSAMGKVSVKGSRSPSNSVRSSAASSRVTVNMGVPSAEAAAAAGFSNSGSNGETNSNNNSSNSGFSNLQNLELGLANQTGLRRRA